LFAIKKQTKKKKKKKKKNEDSVGGGGGKTKQSQCLLKINGQFNNLFVVLFKVE